METEVRKLDEVWTTDAQKLGLAHHIYHRLEDVNPELRLYACYLEILNFQWGEDFYVPMDFVGGRDPETGRIKLTVSLREVLSRTWNRMPGFVSRGRACKEDLPAQ